MPGIGIVLRVLESGCGRTNPFPEALLSVPFHRLFTFYSLWLFSPAPASVLVLGIKRRALGVTGKCSSTELCPSLPFYHSQSQRPRACLSSHDSLSQYCSLLLLLFYFYFFFFCYFNTFFSSSFSTGDVLGECIVGTPHSQFECLEPTWNLSIVR